MDTSKIIRGVVSNGRYTVTAPIIKEDYGLYLKIEGVELPSTYEVDFSNSESSGTSVTMIGNADGVLIPRQFIDTGKDVFAFLYHVGANYGRTVYKFRIPNKVRPDRTNEEPTPEEQSVIDQAISALNTAVAQTAQDVISADASAQNASADAERAGEARTDAQNYATQAEQSATDAHESASQASTSATASAQSASEASQSAQSASASATASAQSATASANSATSAQGYSQSASASAQSASGYASNAQTSANTASTKAQDASGYAQTASQKATEASQSATNASQSAQTAEQAETASQTAQGLAESARDDAEQAKDDSEQIKSDVQDLADGIDTRLVDVESDILKAFPTDTASGAIASFSDGADDLPLKSLVVDINPIQDLSRGDPSPENICPISGWTGMQLNANGTVIPINWQTEAGTVYGGKLDVLSGVMRVTHQIYTYDGSADEGWVATASSFYIRNPQKVSQRVVCNAFLGKDPKSYVYLHNGECAMTTSPHNYINFIYSSAASLEEWTAWLAEHPIQLLLQLVTPIEIQLEPHEIASLLGQNNIFADTGDSEVEYRANTELYINKKIAEALASLT